MIATKQKKADEGHFVKMLADAGVVAEEKARALWHGNNGDAIAAMEELVREKPSCRNQLGEIWGDQLGKAYIDTKSTLVQPDLVQRLPYAIARKHTVLPLYEFGAAVTVAAAHPEDPDLPQVLENYFDRFVSLVFSFPSEIQSTVEFAYLSEGYLSRILTGKKIPQMSDPGARIDAVELARLAGNQAIIDFWEGVTLLAIKESASDIHIEPQKDGGRIRFRIDGLLETKFRLEPNVMPPLLSRLKVLSDLDLAEHRHPQDGRATVTLADRDIDLRISTVPTLYGEKAVVRLLGNSQIEGVPNLQELGLSPSCVADFHELIRKISGIIFVTGPTGCGKTTTLYSVLKLLHSESINIMTAEDPIEYQLPGINQVQANPAIGLSFAKVLRSFLRQDPDVILIGEIRDPETARIACQAALTGHLVLTTLHTDTALHAVIRLLDMGVEPYLVLPAVRGVTAQRLVRRLCDHCKVKRELTPQEMSRYFEWDGENAISVWEPVGCDRCNNVGYSGRTPLQEAFTLTEEVKEKLSSDPSLTLLKQLAREQGFKPMLYDGLKKVVRGITTLAELDRAVGA